MWQDFKEFASQGNVLDLAVAVIIGATFSNIVSSLVDDIMMPLVGLLLGGISFEGLKFSLGDATIKYGVFIQNVVDFVIIAFSIFLFIRLLNKFRKAQDEVEINEQTELLTEIRDLLKK
ncbi:large conductance mechanosensitive channel protein MscL [Pueribacillus sp. YX66]|uniref:large conductance mechanosensitive channel protein MscL n=1 Tax=Pueribacillus sp. YX66 TaxID=3229242 RepID=UPI00358D154F